ncbi:MAG: pseudaminic acid synthase [bacterium]
MPQEIELNNRKIGDNHPIYFVAEMSANHNQDLDRALEIVEAASEAGADAIKIQTYKPGNMTLNMDTEEFTIGDGTDWAGQNLYELYKEAYTPWEWHEPIRDKALELGIDFFSTAFSKEAVEYLDELGVPIHKTASFELVDLPLIRAMANTGKPLILSTGMGTLGEIEEAVRTARDAGCEQIALLHCVSSYPADPQQMNLNTIENLQVTFDVVPGLSDHTLSSEVVLGSVPIGAKIIEKHFTLSRDVDTPDSNFSLEPDEFESMVESVRLLEDAQGEVHYGITEAEQNSTVFRRSLFDVEEIKEGEELTEKNIRRIRPGNGLKPKYYNSVIGRTASRDLKRGTPLQWEHVT